MPTYEFLHDVEDCKHEWEDFLSIKAPDPTHCPKCAAEGHITRLISGGSGKGKVELTGHELNAKIKEDAQKFKKEVYSDAKTYANVIGEQRYHDIQSRMDRRGK